MGDGAARFEQQFASELFASPLSSHKTLEAALDAVATFVAVRLPKENVDGLLGLFEGCLDVAAEKRAAANRPVRRRVALKREVTGG